MAIGCTGGRHRSVAIAEHLAEHYGERGDYTVGVAHRDIDKPPRAHDRPRGWWREYRPRQSGSRSPTCARSGRFYDAVFFALGVRRMLESEHAIAYGVTARTFWLKQRMAPAPGYGHVALHANGKAAVDAAHAAGLANGGADDGAAGPAAPVRAALLRRLPARPRRAARRGRQRRGRLAAAPRRAGQASAR